MRWILAMGLGTLCAACGADGEPVQPTRNATITLSDAGVSGGLGLGMTQGPVSVSVGLGL
ncbi:hypothetical protein [Sulfitobacter noctilucae]|uniref:hypothetical protein n=1 Tax=Sulfitobacter noctilucae TaxID=1342302 RepID=UPI0009DF4ADD|nr:hypothetical protein [Sulfitobacter noctilucae]